MSEIKKSKRRESKLETELHSYEGGTHVYSTDAISPIFNAKYTKDLNAVINNMQAMILAGEE